MTTTLLHGDCRNILTTLPERSVQCVVTSPPYFGLRRYDVEGAQIGMEQSPAEYVASLVEVFRQVKRVLRDDGTLWVNLGDGYNAYNGNRGPAVGANKNHHEIMPDLPGGYGLTVKGLGNKQLLGIPWRVAFALQDDGWILRSDIIWHKPNPMPESVTDRPTRSHEYIFLFAKSPRYYYDAAAIAEPIKQSSIDRISQPTFDQQHGGPKDYGTTGVNSNRSMRKTLENFAANGSGTRNRRSVWTIPTRPYSGAHFAVFPEQLIEPCILAGSAAQACEHCGAPWERQIERESGVINLEEGKRQALRSAGAQTGGTQRVTLGVTEHVRRRDFGFRPSCTCPNDGAARSVVLDPFVGSGTTCRVAEKFGRDSIGIDLGYQELQEKRTDGVQKVMVDLL